MKLFGWAIAIVAAIAFGASFWAETRFAPIVGAVLLAASIAYATWMTNTDRASYIKAERATRKLRKEEARARS